MARVTRDGAAQAVVLYRAAYADRMPWETVPDPPPAVRTATTDDGPALARLLAGIVAEGTLSALDQPVTAASETAWLRGLDERSVVHVVEIAERVVGFQSLEPYDTYLHSLAHVAVVGTQLAPAVRGRGLGRALWESTAPFARAHGYEKVIAAVRRGNERALRFYRALGFTDIGIARRQVRIRGRYEDEVFLEGFLLP